MYVFSNFQYKVFEINFMGTSIINEIVGYYDPRNYPIIKCNSNSGLRFFGFNIQRYR